MKPPRMLGSVFARAVRDQRRSLIGWAIAFAGIALMITALFPSIAADAEQFQQLAESYPDAIQAFIGDLSDIASPEGFLRAELFTMFFPLMLLVYAIGRGADLIAGEEERGSLDTLLAHPLSRRRVFIQRFGALTTGAAMLGAVSWLALSVGDIAFGLGVGAAKLAAVNVMLVLVALLFGATAFAIGAWSGRKTWAVALASGLAVTSYLATSVARLVPRIEGIRFASPFHYYERGDPLVHGLPLLDALILITLIVALLALALWKFERRDIGVA